MPPENSVPIARKKPIYYTDQIDEQVIDIVVDAFGIEGLRGARPMTTSGRKVFLLSDRGMTAKKVILQTTRGALFLKQVPWYCSSEEQVRFICALWQHVSTCGVPVPQLRCTTKGVPWYRVGEDFYVVADLRTGSTYQGTVGERLAAARMLAAFHRASASFPLAHAPSTSLASIVDSHISLASSVLGRSSALDECRTLSARNFRDYDGLPTLVVHGDYIPWNLAFDTNGVCALYDLDNASCDSRLHDLGEAVVAFFGLVYDSTNSRLLPGGFREPAATEVAAFIACYEEGRPLTDRENAALPAYVLGAWLECLLLSFIRGEQPASRLAELQRLPALVSDLWAKMGLRKPRWKSA
jgi:Ser/Thr protein kinase RdoA (MazF antagonist)